MKIFRKTLALLLAMLLLATSAFAYSGTVLNYLGVVPRDIADNTIVTREYLAYSIANMLTPNVELDPLDTSFADVKADNPYSGYIAFVADRGYMSGAGNGYFSPKANVSLAVAAKTVVSILGYDLVAQNKGGWPHGYITVASELKLLRGVDTSGEYLRYSDLKEMLINAMDVKLPDESYYASNGQIDIGLATSSDGKSFAQKSLNLTEYSALITDVDYEHMTAKVLIKEAPYLGKYLEGSTVSLDIWEGINIAKYENAPVRIALYEEKLIADVEFDGNINIKFGVVESVNNETLDISYGVNHISAITLVGDEEDYKFDSDCSFNKNSKPYSGSLKLLNKYVKIVYDDDNILSLATWDLTNVNAVIGEAGENYLSYKMGNDERRLDKIAEATEKLVIIDGEIRDYTDLKSDMVFSYYRNTDEGILIIVATQMRVTDKLEGYSASDKKLYIGNLEIDYLDSIKFSEDGVNYSSGIEKINDYMDLNVTAVLDIYGKACYIIKYSGEITSNKFIGYLLGLEEATGFKGPRAKIVNFDSSETVEKVYNMAKTVRYNGTLTEGIVKSSIGTKDGSALYEIELNSMGEVCGFSKLKDFEGFEGKTWTTAGWLGFASGGYLIVSNKFLFIPNDTPVLCVHDDGSSELEFFKIPYSMLLGQSAEAGVTLRFFGHESIPDLRAIVMVGNVNVISGSGKSGVVKRIGKTLNAEGELVTSVNIDGKDYELDKLSPAVPEEKNFVSYAVSIFDSNVVTVKEAFDLEESLSKLDGIESGRSTFKYGHVEKADRLKVVLEGSVDGDLCYYYNPSSRVVWGVDSKGEIKSDFGYQDLEPGMEVVLELVADNNGNGARIDRVFARKD